MKCYENFKISLFWKCDRLSLILVSLFTDKLLILEMD